MNAPSSSDSVNDLSPRVPFDQLSQFLNNHVSGSVKNVTFTWTHLQFELQLLKSINGVREERFRDCHEIAFSGFFRFLPWVLTRQLFDTVLHSRMFNFYNPLLPVGVDPDAFLQLRAIRECTILQIFPLNDDGAGADRLRPKFSSKALLEWLKEEEIRDESAVRLPEECLADGLEGFMASVWEVGCLVYCTGVLLLTRLYRRTFPTRPGNDTSQR